MAKNRNGKKAKQAGAGGARGVRPGSGANGRLLDISYLR